MLRAVASLLFQKDEARGTSVCRQQLGQGSGAACPIHGWNLGEAFAGALGLRLHPGEHPELPMEEPGTQGGFKVLFWAHVFFLSFSGGFCTLMQKRVGLSLCGRVRGAGGDPGSRSQLGFSAAAVAVL